MGFRLLGHLDDIRGRAVLGWAWRPDRPSDPVRLRLRVDGIAVAEGTAALHRPDLQEAGIGDGSHSFCLLLPEPAMDGGQHEISVEDLDGVPIDGSPLGALLADQRTIAAEPDPTVYAWELAICAIAKDEAPYLREWIAFHRAVGVDHFLIFDNDSSDGTSELLDALAGTGWVERVAWPSRAGTAPQLSAYAEGLRLLRGRARWIAFIDLDEFLHPLAEPCIGSVLRDFGDVGGLAVPWRIFGSSGAADHVDRFVLERFTRRAEADAPVNHAIKTIGRSRFLVEPGVHAPRRLQGPLMDEHRRIAGSYGDPDHHPIADAGRLVLHHYFTKSRAEWQAKRLRGCADHRPSETPYLRPDTHFDLHDRNEVEDRSILRFVPAMRRVLAELEAVCVDRRS